MIPSQSKKDFSRDGIVEEFSIYGLENHEILFFTGMLMP
jgi:hypothetical protein